MSVIQFSPPGSFYVRRTLAESHGANLLARRAFLSAPSIHLKSSIVSILPIISFISTESCICSSAHLHFTRYRISSIDCFKSGKQFGWTGILKLSWSLGDRCHCLHAKHQVCTKIESVVNMNLIDCPFACGTNCTKGSRHPVWDRSRVVCSWDLFFSSIGRLRFQEVAYYTRWRQNLTENRGVEINSVRSYLSNW